MWILKDYCSIREDFLFEIVLQSLTTITAEMVEFILPLTIVQQSAEKTPAVQRVVWISYKLLLETEEIALAALRCSDEQCSITARRFLAQTSGRGVCEDVACYWFPLTVQGLSPSVTWDMDGWIHWDGSKLTSSLWASVMLVFRVL